MSVDIDVSGADSVARDLETVGRLLDDFGRVVKRGAHNLKSDYQREARSSGHYKHFHRAISYDRVTSLEYEVGPDKSKMQGALGNILYFGTSKNAPELDLHGPIARELPRFEQALADAAEEVL